MKENRLQQYQVLSHTFDPVWNEESRILVLGTFPSVKSRENQFYYGHPQNRFWKLLAAIFQERLPKTTEEKKALLLGHGIAVWDVIASCEIKGSSDSSIRNVVPNDVSGLVLGSRIHTILANGGKAYELYNHYQRSATGMEAQKMPSTSPANAAWSLQRLEGEWGKWLLEGSCDAERKFI